MSTQQTTNGQDNVLQLASKVPFTQVSNEVLNDANLSWKAKGIYGCLFSKATMTGWTFRKAHLIKQSKDGKTSFEKGIKELKENGYLEIVSRRKKNGEYNGWTWNVYASKAENPNFKQPESLENRNTINPKSRKPVLRETRITGNPHLYSNTVVNKTNSNKTERNTYVQNQKTLDPNGSDYAENSVMERSPKENNLHQNRSDVPKKRKKTLCDYKREAEAYYLDSQKRDKEHPLYYSYKFFEKVFDIFRPSSRGGKKKMESFIAWHELIRANSKDEAISKKEIITKIVEHIQASIKYDRDWLKGHAPLFSTYLIQRRWEDDVKRDRKLGDPSDFSDKEKLKRSRELVQELRERSRPNI